MDIKQISANIESLIEESMPEKCDTYVSYDLEADDFYVSTTDDDSYDGRISLDAIIDNFIEGYIRGPNGTIEACHGQLFASRFRAAADRVLAVTDS